MEPEFRFRCHICNSWVRPGEPYARQGDFVYHLACFRRVGARQKFPDWLQETLRKRGRVGKVELLRMAWRQGYGVNQDHLEYFLDPLVRAGLVREEEGALVWAGEGRTPSPSPPPERRRPEPRIKPPNVLL